MIESYGVAALIRTLENDSDGELAKSLDLTLRLLQHTPYPFSRHQFTPGHITCTGLVYAPETAEILLVHHNRLDRWLPPGGHCEPEDAEIWEVARREVIEETGVELLSNGQPRLIGIDVHGIPPRKKEPYHLHHDLLFVFQARSKDFQLSRETRAVAWLSPAEFDSVGLPGNVRRAVIRFNA